MRLQLGTRLLLCGTLVLCETLLIEACIPQAPERETRTDLTDDGGPLGADHDAAQVGDADAGEGAARDAARGDISTDGPE